MSGADKNDCATWCTLPADHEGPCRNPMLDAHIEENANLVLWCVHLIGPDDIYAEPSHAIAVAKAEELNRTIQASPKHPNDILCFAYADMWPYTAAQHAQAIEDEAAQETERKAAVAAKAS